jgi:hypothetical protein
MAAVVRFWGNVYYQVSYKAAIFGKYGALECVIFLHTD